MTDTFTKRLPYIFGIFALSARLIFLAARFSSQHDTLLFFWIIVGLVAFVFGLTFLIAAISKGIKKNLRGLSISAGILLIVFLLPFEYVFGWTLHQLNKNTKKELVADLKLGKYDSLISKNEYKTYGTWITDKRRVKVLKDTSLQLLFIPQGDITSYNYYGTLYISDISKIDNKKVSTFINCEYDKKYLGNNWYLVECYVDTSPGP